MVPTLHAPQAPSSLRGPPRPAARPTRVLPAEDDAALRALLEGVLAADGYDVVVARDGEELLEHLGSTLLREAEAVDVVVADHCMPGFTGLEVLRGIRAAQWRLGAPCAPGDAERLQVSVLEKPFDIDDLRRVLRRLAGPLGCEGSAPAEGVA